MKKQRCPVCGEGFLERLGLAQHCVLRHLHEDATWKLLCCWCGWPLFLRSPRYAEDYHVAKHLLSHVDRFGGLTAHYHAALLGIDRWSNT